MPQRPSDWRNAKPPAPHQKGWPKIVNMGCQGTRDYWGEYDCVYPWACDSCPVLVDSEQRKEDEFIGPPQPQYFFFD